MSCLASCCQLSGLRLKVEKKLCEFFLWCMQRMCRKPGVLSTLLCTLLGDKYCVWKCWQYSTACAFEPLCVVAKQQFCKWYIITWLVSCLSVKKAEISSIAKKTALVLTTESFLLIQKVLLYGVLHWLGDNLAV